MKLYRTTAKAHFLSDADVRIKIERGWLAEITVTDKGVVNTYVLDSAGVVYDSGNRQWDEELGKYFYPYATEDVAELINRAFVAINGS